LPSPRANAQSQPRSKLAASRSWDVGNGREFNTLCNQRMRVNMRIGRKKTGTLDGTRETVRAV
jgi:hypothetical protein